MTRRSSLLSLALLALAATACGRYLTTGAAVVNGVSISQERLDDQLASVLANPQFQGSIDPNDAEQRLQIQRQVIIQLVRQELLRQEAVRLAVRVGDAEITSRFQQVRSQFATEEQFQEALRANSLDAETLREQIRLRLLEESLLERVAGGLQATEDEIRAAYGNGQRFEEIRVRHILYTVQPGADEAAARAKAQQALARLKAGTDFATLARQQSEDPGSKAQGGDLGYVARDVQFDETFKQAAFALRKGQLSDLVRTQFGFHIIRVDDRRTKTLEQARAELTQEITDAKREQTFQEWLTDRVRTARIVVNPRYGDFDPTTLQIEAHEFFVPPSPEPETQAIPTG